jgi:hypothetical protein
LVGPPALELDVLAAPPEAAVGDPVAELDAGALVVDSDAEEPLSI